MQNNTSHDTKKIKICHVASVDITVKFLLIAQLKFLIEQGFDVYVVCSAGKWKEEIEKQGIKVKNIEIKRKITPFYDLITLWKLFLYFKKEKFNIVHTHTPKPGLLGQLAAKAAGIPIIINTIHGLYFSKESSSLKRSFFILIEKIAASCSTLIFSQNKEDIATMIDNKITNQEKIKYLGNGTDVEKFNSKRFSQEFINNKKNELGINPEAQVVGSVGRLVREKGYLELFEAFKEVLNKFPKAVLIIIGPKDLEKKDAFLPEIIKEYGIEKNVIFLGERTDLDEIFPLMDVFVLASHREGFPRTIVEAMASSRPTIATNIRGCNEAIDNNENGILIKLKDSSSLSNAIITLLKNPSLSNKLSKNARKKAEEEFDENKIFNKIEKEYKNLLNQNKLNIPKKYLITGGAGFIGSHLANKLIETGNDVVVIDNFFSESGLKLNSKIKVFILDISDRKIFDIFEKEKPDVVYHLAGPIGLRNQKTDKSFTNSLNYLDNLKNILDCSVLFKVKKFIFLSSGGAVYSGANVIPTTEEYIPHPESPYGLANIQIGNSIIDYNKQKGLDFVILRFSNVYGPYQWSTGAIPNFIEQILKGNEIIIYGDGSETRDFIYIDDAVEALILAESLENSIWNVGSGKEVSLNQLYKKISDILKQKTKIIYNNKLEFINRSCLDISKINKDLNWEPKTSLDDGLKKTISWYGKKFK